MIGKTGGWAYGAGGLLSAGDNYMLWKGQPWLVLGNRGELLSAFWKAGAMLERGWREPLMGLAEKQLLMRRISVNFEVSYARISTLVVASRMSRAEMTYLVRKEAYVWGQDSFKGNNTRDGWETSGSSFCLAEKESPRSSHLVVWLTPWTESQSSFCISMAGGSCLLWIVV